MPITPYTTLRMTLRVTLRIALRMALRMTLRMTLRTTLRMVNTIFLKHDLWLRRYLLQDFFFPGFLAIYEQCWAMFWSCLAFDWPYMGLIWPGRASVFVFPSMRATQGRAGRRNGGRASRASMKKKEEHPVPIRRINPAFKPCV